jgi:uncharacterized membrane-anchored protein
VSLVTANEWLVIIIAAAAFILLNIVIWTLVAAKHRRAAGPPQEQAAPEALSGGTVPVQPEDTRKSRKTASKAAAQPDTPLPVRRERKMREDFRLIDNIIIVHTNERL